MLLMAFLFIACIRQIVTESWFSNMPAPYPRKMCLTRASGIE